MDEMEKPLAMEKLRKGEYDRVGGVWIPGLGKSYVYTNGESSLIDCEEGYYSCGESEVSGMATTFSALENAAKTGMDIA